MSKLFRRQFVDARFLNHGFLACKAERMPSLQTTYAHDLCAHWIFLGANYADIYGGEPFAGQDWGQKKAFLHGVKSRTERFHILHILYWLAGKCNVVWLSNYSRETWRIFFFPIKKNWEPFSKKKRNFSSLRLGMLRELVTSWCT